MCGRWVVVWATRSFPCWSAARACLCGAWTLRGRLLALHGNTPPTPPHRGAYVCVCMIYKEIYGTLQFQMITIVGRVWYEEAWLHSPACAEFVCLGLVRCRALVCDVVSEPELPPTIIHHGGTSHIPDKPCNSIRCPPKAPSSAG